MNSRLEKAYLGYDPEKDTSSLRTRGDGGHRLASAVGLVFEEEFPLEKCREFYERVFALGRDLRDINVAASIVGTYFPKQYGNNGKTPIFFIPYWDKLKIISHLKEVSKQRIKQCGKVPCK
jgi:hypothetical protein